MSKLRVHVDLLTAIAMLLIGLLARRTQAQTSPAQPVHGYADAWSSVLALHPRAPIAIATGASLHRCEFAGADEASVTCVRRLHAPYGEVSMPITFDRSTVREIALDLAPSRQTRKEDAVGAGALGGGTLGLLAGGRIGKSGEDAARGTVAGALAGAIVAALATRHHERLMTLYLAP